MMKINNKKDLYQFGELITELEDSVSMFQFGESINSLNDYCSEYERIVLCLYDFKPNYLQLNRHFVIWLHKYCLRPLYSVTWGFFVRIFK